MSKDGQDNTFNKIQFKDVINTSLKIKKEIDFRTKPLKGNPNSAAAELYINTLEKLLESEEVKKSEEWTEFITHRLLEVDLLPNEFIDDPNNILILDFKFLSQINATVRQKNGGIKNSAPYRLLEKEIICKAKEILGAPHDGRPPDRYRSSSISQAIIDENNEMPITSRLSLPELSTIKSYIKKAVKNDDLPSFLMGPNPKKW